MKSSYIIRTLDSCGRITLPKEIRKNLKIEETDFIRMYVEGQRLIIEKELTEEIDLFDNLVISEPLYQYHGKKIARSSIIELASIAGLIPDDTGS